MDITQKKIHQFSGVVGYPKTRNLRRKKPDPTLKNGTRIRLLLPDQLHHPICLIQIYFMINIFPTHDYFRQPKNFEDLVTKRPGSSRPVNQRPTITQRPAITLAPFTQPPITTSPPPPTPQTLPPRRYVCTYLYWANSTGVYLYVYNRS